MKTVKDRLRRLDQLETPDVWARARSFEPGLRSEAEPPSPRSGRLVVAVVAFAVFTAAALFAWRSLQPTLVGRSNGAPADLNARIPVPEPQPIVGGEGAVWVVGGTNESDNKLWRIDPATNTATVVEGTQGAMWPAVGEGWAWVTICHAGTEQECTSNDLLKIDPGSGMVVSTIPLGGGYPFAVYAGLGSAWVSTSEGLVKVDPDTDAAVILPAKTDLLGGSNGYLWATGLGGGGIGGVAKIDPVDGEVVESVPFHNPCVIMPTEDGVWVASCQGGLPPGTQPDHLARIDPNTAEVSYDVDLDQWGHLAYSDGSLWLSHWDASGTHVSVEQLDPLTGRATGVQAGVQPGPHPWMSMGLGPPGIFTAILDGSFWLTHVDGDDVVRTAIPT